EPGRGQPGGGDRDGAPGGAHQPGHRGRHREADGLPGEAEPDLPADMTAYGFRPATAADLPMLRTWLRAPEVVRWWGDPAEQAALLEEDLSNPEMAMLIVTADGTPFAYAQHYEVHVWPQPHLEGLPQGARAIDAFVGEPDMIGQGHGRAFLRLLAQSLIDAGAPLAGIDPD